MLMANRRHDRIIEILFDLLKNDEDYKKRNADHIEENYKSINILSNNNRGPSKNREYNPDIWCQLKKTNEIDIIEIWDSQSREACVEDILFSALTPNVCTLSIICFEKKQQKLASELVKLLLSSLFNDEGELLLEPNKVLPYIILISEEIINDDNKIKELLRSELGLK